MAEWYLSALPVGRAGDLARGLQAEFERRGGPRGFAAFSRPHANGLADSVLVPPDAAETAEALLPGIWKPVGRPADGGWRVIAGHSDALIWFGLML